MSSLFKILVVVSAVGVVGAIVEVWRRRREVKRLRDEHGDAYDDVKRRWM
ncbi:hypothetical protein [Rubricoccus marinus]|nr:hypothetical protein [Rubricoccus marinus]